VADQVGCALLDAGELGVELVVAGVVVADQVASVAIEDAQSGQGGFGSGADRRVVHQPRIRGTHGDRVRCPGYRFAVGVGVLADHVGGGLIGAEHVLITQRGFHSVVKPGGTQALGEALKGAGDEPGRDRGAQQGRHQHRTPLDRDIALAGQQDRRGIGPRPVAHGAHRPERWCGGGRVPAAAASPRQQVVHLLQGDRQDVPHLSPAHPRIRRIAQLPATARTPTRRGQCLGPVRRERRREPRALAARLPTRLAIFRAFPRRAIRPPRCLRPDRVLRRRRRGIPRIHPQPTPQLGVLRLQHLHPRGQPHHQRGKLLIRGLGRLGRGHNPNDRQSTTPPRTQHAVTH